MCVPSAFLSREGNSALSFPCGRASNCVRLVHSCSIPNITLNSRFLGPRHIYGIIVAMNGMYRSNPPPPPPLDRFFELDISTARRMSEPKTGGRSRRGLSGNVLFGPGAFFVTLRSYRARKVGPGGCFTRIFTVFGSHAAEYFVTAVKLVSAPRLFWLCTM